MGLNDQEDTVQIQFKYSSNTVQIQLTEKAVLISYSRANVNGTNESSLDKSLQLLTSHQRC